MKYLHWKNTLLVKEVSRYQGELAADSTKFLANDDSSISEKAETQPWAIKKT